MSIIDHHSRWDILKQRLQKSALATQDAASREQKRTREVYRQRAARLAMPLTQDDSGGDITRTLVFSLGGQRWGFPLRDVAQVYPACSLTPVPGAPPWLLGIGSFDAHIRSVIDLAELLRIPAGRCEASGNVLLVRSATGTAAVWVDRVEEVQNVDLGLLTAPDPSSASLVPGLVCGLTSEQLFVLSAHALLAHVVSQRGAHC